jgi:hypothetical protein
LKMLVKLDQATVRFGQTGWSRFMSSGVHGDWQTFNVAFAPPMPATAAGRIRVIVTPLSVGADPAGAVPVAVVGAISPGGFTAWARNCSNIAGEAALNWIAVADVTDTVHQSLVVRTGVQEANYFMPEAWTSWSVAYGESAQFTEVVPVVTITNEEVSGGFAAAAPTLRASGDIGFDVSAVSIDNNPGSAALNYIAFGTGSGSFAGLALDAGRAGPWTFQERGKVGDWQTVDVDFDDAFASPPVVVAVADDLDGNLGWFAPAVLAVVGNVTESGFILGARNADITGGPAAVAWIAVGLPMPIGAV